METMRKATIVVLVGVLFVCQIMIMGIFAVDAGASSFAVKDAIQESDIVAELTDEALTSSTVNMGGEYGDKIKAVMKSKSMTNFFTAYISDGLKSAAYDKKYEEIGNDELTAAFQKGVNQVNAEGTYAITGPEEDIFIKAMLKAVPDLTKNLNQTIRQYSLTTTGDGAAAVDKVEGNTTVSTMMAPSFRLILMAVEAATIIFILMLSRKSGKSGTIRRGGWKILVAMAVACGLYAIIGYRGIGGRDPMSIFMSALVRDGALTVAIGGCVVMIVIFFILLMIGLKMRRKAKEKQARLDAAEAAKKAEYDARKAAEAEAAEQQKAEEEARRAEEEAKRLETVKMVEAPIYKEADERKDPAAIYNEVAESGESPASEDLSAAVETVEEGDAAEAKNEE